MFESSDERKQRFWYKPELLQDLAIKDSQTDGGGWKLQLSKKQSWFLPIWCWPIDHKITLTMCDLFRTECKPKDDHATPGFRLNPLDNLLSLHIPAVPIYFLLSYLCYRADPCHIKIIHVPGHPTAISWEATGEASLVPTYPKRRGKRRAIGAAPDEVTFLSRDLM